MTPRRPLLASLTLVLALVLAACGGDDGSAGAPTPEGGATTTTAATGDGGFPVTVDTPAGPVEIAERPERIVSLSTVATESLFAIGAGDQVIAVDDQSNHPPEAPTSELSGFEPNVEAIAAENPDLVIASGDPGDLVDGLALVGVTTVIQPAAEDLDEVYQQIEQLGTLTGNVEAAADLVEAMRADIDDLLDRVPERSEPLTYFHELDSMLYTVTSSTFIGQLYGLAGFESIADPADDGSAGGYPQLSAEYVIDADPDVIFLADTICCGEDAGTVAARPGWSEITAVETGRVVELDDDIASRWGPRVVDLLEVIVEAAEAADADGL